MKILSYIICLLIGFIVGRYLDELKDFIIKIKNKESKKKNENTRTT